MSGDRIGISAIGSQPIIRRFVTEPDPRRLLLTLLKRKSVVRAAEHSIVGRQGQALEWLVDVRPLLLESASLLAICDIFWQRYGTSEPIQIAGLELSAVALVSALVMRGRQLGYAATGLIIRKSRKKDGLQQIVEGSINGNAVVLVDDIFNSGNSLEKARLVAREHGLRIDSAFVILDFESRYGAQWKATVDFPIHSIFKLKELGVRFAAVAPKNEPALSSFESVWEFKADSPDLFTIIPRSTPLLDDTALYAGMANGRFYSLSQATGDVLWEFEAGRSESKGILSSPAFVGDDIIFGAYDGHLYALNKFSGRPSWAISAADYIGSSPCIAHDVGLIFIGLEFDHQPYQGAVTAFTVDGKKVWSYPFERYLHATPVYIPDSQYVATGSADGLLVLLEAQTGKLIWRCELGSAVRMAPAYDKSSGQLFVGTMSGAFFSIDIQNGRINDQWKAETGIYCTPLISHGHVWFTSTDRHMYAVNIETGDVTSMKLQGRSFSSPALVNGNIICGDNAGFIYEVDPGSFQLAGNHIVTDRVLSKIAFSTHSQRYFAQGSDNRIYAFERRQ
jgi:outer membrane protein assembly factor BamB/orotate phosphoribosyltransferase